MPTWLTVILGLAGAATTAGVAWLLGHRKSNADADSVVVAAAERVVDMLDKRLTEMRAEIDSMHAHVITCEHDNTTLRAQVATLRAENAALRVRVEDLEAGLHGPPPPTDVGA